MNKRFLKVVFRGVDRQCIKMHSKSRIKSPNSFILYRQHMDSVFKRMDIRMLYSKRMASATVSEILGFLWNYEAAEVRACYETLADLERILGPIQLSNNQCLPKDVLISLIPFNCVKNVQETPQSCFDDQHHSATPALLDSFDHFQ